MPPKLQINVLELRCGHCKVKVGELYYFKGELPEAVFVVCSPACEKVLLELMGKVAAKVTDHRRRNG